MVALLVASFLLHTELYFCPLEAVNLESFCMGAISDESSPTDEVVRDGKARKFELWSPRLEIATLDCQW